MTRMGIDIAGHPIPASDPDDVSWALGRGCLDCGTAPDDLCFCATPRTARAEDVASFLVTNSPRASENGVYDVHPDGTVTRAGIPVSGFAEAGIRVTFPSSTVVTVGHPDPCDHKRPSGARTLGGWRRKVMLPSIALAALTAPTPAP